MDTVVVSLGGSVLIPEENDAEHLNKLSGLLKEMSVEHRLLLVCGGGKIARYYIATGRDIGATEKELDELGIMTTRINAKLVSLSLGELAIDHIPTTVEGAAKAVPGNKIVVMGGTAPGHTTDAVSAMLAAGACIAPGLHTSSIRWGRRSQPRLTFRSTSSTAGTWKKCARPSRARASRVRSSPIRRHNIIGLDAHCSLL